MDSFSATVPCRKFFPLTTRCNVGGEEGEEKLAWGRGGVIGREEKQGGLRRLANGVGDDLLYCLQSRIDEVP